MGKKILLADDSITIQKVIELTFSDEDFDVVTVGNGRLAIEKAQEIRPDIVLCDIIMPEKDGYEVCEFIKKTPGLQGIPVLLLTGAFEPFDQDRAARVGSDGFLAKPFEPETLIAKVKDLLSRVAARTPASSPPTRPATGSVPAIPFVPPPRESESSRASSTPNPPLTVVPPRPPEPIPFPRVAPPPEPAKAPPAPPPPVSFIPEEPFEDLDAGSFLADDDPAAARPQEPIPFRSAADELLPMTPEESESLGVPDSASTVMFKAEQASWQAPPPPFAPAAPPLPAAAAPPAREPELPSESPVFEEVIEEDVEFSGAYSPAPPYVAEPAARFEPPMPPVVEEPRPPTFEPELVEVPPSVPSASPAPSRPPASKPPASRPAPTPVSPSPAPPAFARPEPPPPLMPTVAVAPPWLAHPSQEVEAVFEAEPEPVAPPAPSVPSPAPAPPVATPVPAVSALPAEVHAAPVAWVATPAPQPPVPDPSPESFADLVTAVPAAEEAPRPLSEAAGVAVPVEMVEKIAQRVVAQISEKVVREIAWDVIPDLAEALIKAEIERLKAELQRI